MNTTSQMKNLRHIPLDALQELFVAMDEPKFRAAQVHDWLWKKHVGSIDEMSNLPAALREKLNQHFFIPKVNIHQSQFSNDGTIKSSLLLEDDELIEGVLIPTEKRMTACVSSQVGCSLSCKFCATGFMERSRNLTYDEIVDEVTLLNQQAIKEYGRHLSNIVFMGMGEPLLNYSNLLKAIERITAPDGLGMSPRRITVSTSGISKMIRKLGDDDVKFNLAVSLHAATDEKRSDIMPINDTNDLKSLVDALNYYYSKTKNKISFEYILFKDLNDSIEDAKDLVKIYRKVPADLVNIIEYNSVDGTRFQKPTEEVTDRFMAYLEANGVNARMRRSRGKDIDAACGQLANKS